jgi:sugar phosphate isomerase/epimerase
MRIFVSSACFGKNTSVKEIVKILINNGIFNIELGSVHKYETKIRDFLRKVDAEFIIHNYFPPSKKPFIINLASNNKKIRERSIAQVKRAISLARILGSKLYSVHAGFVVDPDIRLNFPSIKKTEAYEQAFKNFVNSLRNIVDFARDRGVKVAVENNVCIKKFKGKLLLCKACEFERLFKEIPSKNLGIALDLGHLNVSARTFKFDRYDFIQKLRRKIFAFHIHDNNGLVDLHKPVAKDSWTLSAISLLDNNNRIPIVLEIN